MIFLINTPSCIYAISNNREDYIAALTALLRASCGPSLIQSRYRVIALSVVKKRAKERYRLFTKGKEAEQFGKNEPIVGGKNPATTAESAYYHIAA